MGLLGQEHGRGLPFPTPGCLLAAGIERLPLRRLHWQVDSLLLSHLEARVRL